MNPEMQTPIVPLLIAMLVFNGLLIVLLLIGRAGRKRVHNSHKVIGLAPARHQYTDPRCRLYVPPRHPGDHYQVTLCRICRPVTYDPAVAERKPK